MFYGILIPFLGTTFGSACVYFLGKNLNKNVQKFLLGFAAGVMIAASVWSLIIPSIDSSSSMGKLAFVPAAIGTATGIAFLFLLDILIPHLHVDSEKPEGLKAKHHDVSCSYAPQYSGRNGGRCCLCGIFRAEPGICGGGSSFIGNCNSEFSRGRDNFNVACRKRRVKKQVVRIRSSFWNCRASCGRDYNSSKKFNSACSALPFVIRGRRNALRCCGRTDSRSF